MPMENKALITLLVFTLIAFFSLSAFWASELNQEPIYFDDPDYLSLEVEDKPLLTEQAKQEAIETGRAWFYKPDGELVIMENVPDKYLED